jgi:hypothetical protein
MHGDEEANMATLSACAAPPRWHVGFSGSDRRNRLQREEQLPGRRSAEQIRHAAEVLVEATLHNERFRPFDVLSDWPPWAYARKWQAKKR